VRFTFTDEQRRFQASMRELLERECTPRAVRALWETETGRSRERWARLAALGLLGVLVPERLGGLGLTEVDLVLPLEETGRAALPEPVLETAAVAVPLLAGLGSSERADEWLRRIAAGEAVATVGCAADPWVADAHVADLLLLPHGDEIHAVPRARVALESQPAVDPSRRLFRVTWTPAPDTRVAAGEEGRRLAAAALDRGALAAAAQLCGVGQRLLDLAVRHATQREQFGRPIGSFQAVKHLLANVAVRLELARPVVYRAAFSVARDAATRAADVSHAKAAASEAAGQAARAALQVHGAVGYTWEMDLHIWMKRAWALEAAWGTGAWHRARVARAVLDGADGGDPT
jgi:alkylation response protein AidB-like acyl-CoA dehydrogenase